MKHIALIIFLASASQVFADVLVSNRTIRPGDIIASSDVTRIAGSHPNGYSDPLDVIGQEARVALYPNRPIQFEQVGPPALVERNEIVTLIFQGTKLAISTEGRSLERGGVGDRVRIMNLSSRTTVFGYVQADGSIKVVQ